MSYRDDVEDILPGYKDKKKPRYKVFNYFVRFRLIINEIMLIQIFEKYRIDFLIYKNINNTTMILVQSRECIFWKTFSIRNQFKSLDFKFRADTEVCDELVREIECSGVKLIDNRIRNNDDDEMNLPF